MQKDLVVTLQTPAPVPKAVQDAVDGFSQAREEVSELETENEKIQKDAQGDMMLYAAAGGGGGFFLLVLLIVWNKRRQRKKEMEIALLNKRISRLSGRLTRLSGVSGKPRSSAGHEVFLK